LLNAAQTSGIEIRELSPPGRPSYKAPFSGPPVLGHGKAGRNGDITNSTEDFAIA
jgi:hypothetical protein